MNKVYSLVTPLSSFAFLPLTNTGHLESSPLEIRISVETDFPVVEKERLSVRRVSEADEYTDFSQSL